MDEFSYLSVLISIILGLGITRLLQGLGQQIEFRGHIRSYWPALCWAMTLLLIHVQTWWSMFGLRFVTHWTFLGFLVVLLQPIVLYLQAALILPSMIAGETVDLRAHYYAQSRGFFGLMCALLLISLAKSLMLSGALPQAADLGFHLVFLALSALVTISRRPRLHEINALTAAAMIGAYIVVLFSQLR
jgi:hypothetical protein